MTTLEKMAKAVGDIVNEAGGMKKAKRKQAQRQAQQNNQNQQSNQQNQNTQNNQSGQQNQPQPNMHQAELVDYTNKILSAEKGDNLHFGIREMSPGSTREDENFISSSEFTLAVSDVVNDVIRCSFVEAEGDKGSEYTRSLEKAEILISGREPLQIVGEQIQMFIKYKRKNKNTEDYIIRDVFYLDINKTVPTDDDDGGKATISREKFREKILNDPDLANSQIHKQGIFNTLAGASPTGLYYLQQQVNQEKLNNTYLKKGSYVTFKVVSTQTYSGYLPTGGFDTFGPHAKKGYVFKVIDDNTWRKGRSDISHWELTILEQGENKNYKVKVEWCTNYNSCQTKGEAMIKVTNIKNK